MRPDTQQTLALHRLPTYLLTYFFYLLSYTAVEMTLGTLCATNEATLGTGGKECSSGLYVKKSLFRKPSTSLNKNASPTTCMCCLQSIQKAAARLVTGTRRCDHISPVPRHLHWLPVWQRVEYKVVHQALSGNALSYLSDGCCSASSPTPAPQDCARQRLERFVLVGRAPTLATEPSVQLELESGTYLPTDLRQPGLSYSCFRQSLNTFYLVSLLQSPPL